MLFRVVDEGSGSFYGYKLLVFVFDKISISSVDFCRGV